MPYQENYEQQTRRRKLTNAVVPGQGLIDQPGMTDDAISEYAGRRAGELEKAYRARDLERDMADLESWGALERRKAGYEGAANAARFIGEGPGREQAVREEEWNAGPPHQRKMEEIGAAAAGRFASPYLGYLGRLDTNNATRERTRAQYGDPMQTNPDAAEHGSGGMFGALGGLMNRILGRGQTPAGAAPKGAPAQSAPAGGPAAAAPAADAGQDYDPETLVGELRRAYPNASPRDLVNILNEEVDGDPADIEAATRLILGLQR